MAANYSSSNWDNQHLTIYVSFMINFQYLYQKNLTIPSKPVKTPPQPSTLNLQDFLCILQSSFLLPVQEMWSASQNTPHLLPLLQMGKVF